MKYSSWRERERYCSSGSIPGAPRKASEPEIYPQQLKRRFTFVSGTVRLVVHGVHSKLTVLIFTDHYSNPKFSKWVWQHTLPPVPGRTVWGWAEGHRAVAGSWPTALLDRVKYCSWQECARVHKPYNISSVTLTPWYERWRTWAQRTTQRHVAFYALGTGRGDERRACSVYGAPFVIIIITTAMYNNNNRRRPTR